MYTIICIQKDMCFFSEKMNEIQLMFWSVCDNSK